jgi:hypothetical protein
LFCCGVVKYSGSKEEGGRGEKSAGAEWLVGEEGGKEFSMLLGKSEGAIGGKEDSLGV